LVSLIVPLIVPSWANVKEIERIIKVSVLSNFCAIILVFFDGTKLESQFNPIVTGLLCFRYPYVRELLRRIK
jgi:hypothetical protein